MPSTRRQKAKARRSRDMDMLSDYDNLDVMLGNENNNPIERELAEAIDQPTGTVIQTCTMKMNLEITYMKMNL